MLAIDDTGAGDPGRLPVVLLHGLTATRHYVVMGSRALERAGHRVVAYDARGHGDSDPAAPYDYAALVADLLGVLDDRGIDRALLAGASMGAHTALRVALEHPGRVAGLVLVTPAFLPGEREDFAGWDRLARGLREGGVEGFVAAYDLDRVPERWRETVVTVLRQRMARHAHPQAVADALEQVPRSEPFASLEDLGGLRVPVAVVASRDEADPGHPLRVGRAWADAIPSARLVVEAEGESPLAWQGGRLSRVIAGTAARARA